MYLSTNYDYFIKYNSYYFSYMIKILKYQYDYLKATSEAFIILFKKEKTEASLSSIFD